MPVRPIVIAVVALAATVNAALSRAVSSTELRARAAQFPEIPDVTGKPRDTALKMLARTKLPVVQVESSTARFPLNTVIVQRPPAHSPISRARAETIFVASAPRRIPLPVLTGRIPGVVTRPPAISADSAPPPRPSGDDVRPSAPTRTVVPLGRGNTVAVPGVVVQDTTRVPDLYDRDARGVGALIQEYRLTPGEVRRDYSDSVAAGHVFRQHPERGTVVAAKTRVDVWYSIGPHPRAATIIVPDVRGLTYVAASDSLKRARLSVGHVDTLYQPRANGTVSHQEPHEGTKAHPDDKIDLTIALVPPLVRVPNVTGMSRVSAEEMLKRRGLGVGTVTQVAIAGRDTNIVAQRPDSGTSVNPGFLVDLFENRPPVVRRVLVPSLFGLSREAARDSLRRTTLFLGEVVDNDNGAAPTVALQDPLPGTSVLENSRVNVTLTSPRDTTRTPPDTSTGTEVFVRVPPVVNLTAERARRILNDSGFTIVTMTGDTVTAAAVVDSQRPQAGDLVQVNSPVSLFTSFVAPRKVPSVMGQPEEEARATASADQLKIAVTGQHRVFRLRAVVDSQSPFANANARPDAIIDVRLAIPVVPPLPTAIVLSAASIGGVVLRRSRINGRKSPKKTPRPPVEVTLEPILREPEKPTLSSGGDGKMIRHSFALTFDLRAEPWTIEPAGVTLIKPKERTNG